ncbi:hypothetical protein [Naasia sp.]|jgi:hypothetical protein|uniref:hypothetical protein n=1 Tax=Naasia sp. TaxID=2546198 RepID=UPI00261270E0|nr:hypothetical protein [Naasia sp.]
MIEPSDLPALLAELEERPLEQRSAGYLELLERLRRELEDSAQGHDGRSPVPGPR